MSEVADTVLESLSGKDERQLIKPPCAEEVGASDGPAPPADPRKSRRRLLAAKRVRLVPTIIIDKSPLFRTGLEHIIGRSRFRVTAGVASVAAVSAQIFGNGPCGNGPCVAMVSLDEDAPTTLSQLRSLKEEYHHLRVIVFTAELCPKELISAIGAGADGYLLKNEISPDALLQSLELVLLGAIVLPRALTKQLKGWIGALGGDAANLASMDPEPSVADGAMPQDSGKHLSGRQRLILQLLTRGASNKEIAHRLDISEATVKVHLKSLLRKINVNNRTQAAMWALGKLYYIIMVPAISFDFLFLC